MIKCKYEVLESIPMIKCRYEVLENTNDHMCRYEVLVNNNCNALFLLSIYFVEFNVFLVFYLNNCGVWVFVLCVSIYILVVY